MRSRPTTGFQKRGLAAASKTVHDVLLNPKHLASVMDVLELFPLNADPGRLELEVRGTAAALVLPAWRAVDEAGEPILGVAVQTTEGERWISPYQGAYRLRPPPPPPWVALDTQTAEAVRSDRARAVLLKAGVGLWLQRDRPDSPLNAEPFVEDLWAVSCHPFFGRRILEDLTRDGQRGVTVQGMFAERLAELTDLFARHGVRVTRTVPWPPDGPAVLPEGEPIPPLPTASHRAPPALSQLTRPKKRTTYRRGLLRDGDGVARHATRCSFKLSKNPCKPLSGDRLE